MIKVIHVGYVHTYRDTRILQKECKTLQKNRFDVEYITSNKNAEYSQEYYEGIKVHILDVKQYNGKQLFGYIKALKKQLLKMNGDIYHIHEPLLLPIVFWLKKNNKKVIYDMHEDSANDMGDYFKKYGTCVSFLVKNIMKLYEKKGIAKSDGFIYVTPQFEKQGTKIKNKALIPNFPLIESELTSVSYEDYCQRKDSICFAGGIGSIWSHEKILEIISKLKNIEYNLAGHSTEMYINELKNMKGWEKTNYYGVVSHQQVKEIYAQSKVGICLLDMIFDKERMGTLGNTKIYEFMAAGLPIICTDFKLWKAMVDKYHCGIAVDVNDNKKIENAMEFLMENVEEAFKMGLNGIYAVKNEYNWKQLEPKLLKIYSEIIADME